MSRLFPLPAAIKALPLREARAEFERTYLRAHLKQQRNNMPATARAVGVERESLYRKLKDLEVSRSATGRAHARS